MFDEVAKNVIQVPKVIIVDIIITVLNRPLPIYIKSAKTENSANIHLSR